jgi:predicted dehydrogenase
LVKLGVQVVALSDIRDDQLDKAKQIGPEARTFHDYRGALDLKAVDAALIATPDHWHAPIGMDSLHAGKDVYIEKPLTLKPDEGPAIVKAARVNRRVCQVGMQQRSGKRYLEAKREYLDSGKLGKLTLARTWWHGNSYHLRRAPASLQTKPENLDWAAYLGRLKWRDWGPAAVLGLASLSRLRRRAGHRSFHPLDRCRPHVHATRQSHRGKRYRRRLQLQRWPHGPDKVNVLLEYPAEFTATFEATLAPGITGAAVEFAGAKGRLLIDTGVTTNTNQPSAARRL